jgi:hypothetical protein
MGVQEFRVIWPEALKAKELEADFGRIAGATAAFEDGRVVVRFPPPFADLALTHGEQLTLAKAAHVYQAMKFFNARLEETTDGR